MKHHFFALAAIMMIPVAVCLGLYALWHGSLQEIMDVCKELQINCSSTPQ